MTAAAPQKTRTLDLEKLHLGFGSHASGDGFCVMEAVAFIAGEKWSDNPQCASPVIGAFLRTWNDALDDEGRQKLKPYIPKLVGSVASKEIEDKRGWLCVDWLVRHYTPAWLELAGLKEQADALRAIAELHDLKSVESANPKISKAVEVSSAARSAAESAARSAARSAAWSAARSAAESAAWSAAESAAWSAADAALAPTKQSLQQSAFELLDRMLALS